MKKPGKKQRILDKEVERMQQMVQRREQKLSQAKTKLAQAEDRAKKHRERKPRAKPEPVTGAPAEAAPRLGGVPGNVHPD